MTREEGLDWLYRLRSEIYVYMPKEWLIPMNNALDMAISALSENKGEWIVFSGGYICSKCRENGKIKVKNVASHYCPDCGADMRPEPYKTESEE